MRSRLLTTLSFALALAATASWASPHPGKLSPPKKTRPTHAASIGGVIGPGSPAPGSPAPGAPTSLSVSNYSNASSIQIQWIDNSTNEDSFTIEREAEGETSFTPIGSVSSPNVLGTGYYVYYTDSNLALDTAYTYRVKAVNATDASGYSNTVVGMTAPIAPGGLSAAAVAGSDSQIKLTWTDNSRHEIVFSIYRKGAHDTGFSQVGSADGVAGTGGTQTYTATGLDSGTAYEFYVLAYNPAGYSDPSNHATATTNATNAAPAAPYLYQNGYSSSGDQYLRAVGPASIRATYVDQSTNEDSFTLEQKSEDQANWAVVATDPGHFATGTTYPHTLSGLAADTRYSYRAQAHNTVGDSPYSAVYPADTAPAASDGLTGAAVAGKDDSVALTWTSHSRHETYFRVYSKGPTDSGFAYAYSAPAVNTPGQSVTYTATGLNKNTAYQFYVTAYNDAGESAATNTVTATTNDTQTAPAAPYLYQNGPYYYGDPYLHPSGPTSIRATYIDQSTNEYLAADGKPGFTLEQKSEDDFEAAGHLGQEAARLPPRLWGHARRTVRARWYSSRRNASISRSSVGSVRTGAGLWTEPHFPYQWRESTFAGTGQVVKFASNSVGGR